MEEHSVFIKSHNDVHPEDDETSPSPQHRKTVPIIITLTIFAIIIGTIIIRHYEHDINNSETLRHNGHHRRVKPLKYKETVSVINKVCDVTQHAKACAPDVHKVNNGDVVDPFMVFNITLRLAVNEVANVSLLISKGLIMHSDELNSAFMLRECVSLFDDAVSQLSRAVNEVVVVERMGDLMSWISAAMADLETCVDGLDETGWRVGDEVMRSIIKSSVYLSNSLAIVANMEGLVDRFGVQLG